uniref:Uncharacterized protein n=1 Tax=Astyanax mexicanus TaxID=7994 RepID=A0A8B9HSD0_ASTMX
MQHNCTRYLIFFQYLGTKYSGVMKIPAHQPVEGVQNHIEVSLTLLQLIRSTVKSRRPCSIIRR